MARMIDLVRRSALASNAMQFAARGALLVAPQEMLEILVYLATHNKVFGEQARMTLAGWDESSARTAAANPETPKEVLDYLIDPQNLRPTLLPVLLENPSVSEASLVALVDCATREQVEFLLASARVRNSTAVLSVLVSNPHVHADEVKKIKEGIVPEVPQIESLSPESTPPASPQEAQPPPLSLGAPVDDSAGDVPDETVNAFLSEHAEEIAAEAGKPFQPIGGVHEEVVTEAHATPPEPTTVTSAGTHAGAAAAKRAPIKKAMLSANEQRGSALQKIAKLDIKGRIQLAMKGNKEERSLLIRDGTKIVALAVLESPKITDGEVERFAGQKNVLESVLRAIPMKRRFIKQYPIVRALTSNPRTPIDVSLGLIKHLLTQDLRHLSGNKEVSDTVRKLALKMFKQKLDVTKKGE